MQRIADSIFREGGLKEGVTAKADLEKKKSRTPWLCKNKKLSVQLICKQTPKMREGLAKAAD